MLDLVSTLSGTRSRAHGRGYRAKGLQIPRAGWAVSGRRYYSPSQGHFLGRDSIEEAGGLNLYGFCSNDSVNRWDVLGNSWSVAETNEGTFSVNAIDPSGNQHRWNFSARADAERWGNAWDEQNLDLLWPYILRMSGVDPDANNAPTPSSGSVSFGAISLTTRTELSGYMGALRGLYGASFGWTIDQNSDDTFLDNLLGMFDVNFLFAAIGVPSSATGPRVITLNVGFQAGISDRTSRLFQLASLSRVVNTYTQSMGAPTIEIVPNFIRNAVPGPATGEWNAVRGGADRSSISRTFSGNGIANILFASSRLEDMLGVGSIDSISWVATSGILGFGGERGGAIIGPNSGPYSLAHELGHVMSYVGNAPLNHHSNVNNVMHGPSPRPPMPAYIDEEYYKLLLKFSTSKGGR